MKKYAVVAVSLLMCAACSNPLLKWIETRDLGRGSRSAKMIDSFSFGIAGETAEIRTEPGADGKTPITVILPPGSDPANLTPAITFTGKSLYPSSGTPQNFTHPVTYTVIGQDDTTREYLVTVIVKNNESRSIIWFDLGLPGAGVHLLAEGVVNEPSGQEPGEVILHVPSGTDLSSLSAHIVQTGVSVSTPKAVNSSYSGTVITLTGDFSAPVTYTVRAVDGSTASYLITVIKDKADTKEITALSFSGLENKARVIIGAVPLPDGKIPIIATVPPGTPIGALTPVITYTGVSLVGGNISSGNTGTVTASSPESFASSKDYTVTAENGSVRRYVATVFVSDQMDSSKQITGFYFLFPNAQGTEGPAGIINETAKTIAVTVPHGTDLRSLSPVVYHTGVSVIPISGEPRDFRNSVASPVPYTVTARDGTKQTYMVSVYTDADSGKGITSFDFTNVPGATAIIGGAPGPDGKIPIIVTVPSGTPITSLTPELTHTGISITGDGVSGGPGTVTGSSVDFTNPVSYTVTAQNGDTQTYGVSVLVVPPATPSSQNNGIARIDGFYFASPQAVGVIDQNAKTINVTVPYGTSLGNLVPTIYFTGAKIAGNGGIGETTVNPAYIGANFSSDVSYRVTAVTATITADYTVRVSVAKNAAREITAFSFDGIATGGTSALIASTPGADGKYPVEVVVPLGTSLTNLKPVVTHTGVSISGGGISGSSASTVTGSAADFTNPVSYTVTAQDGQTREYLVTLRAEDNNLKQITGFYFTEPLAAGIINEAAKTIDVTVPSGTSLGALRPTVYYTGASLSPVSGRVNSFSSTAIYTVTARNGTAQPYTVRVNAKPSGAKDITAITFPGAAVIDTIIGAAPGPDGKVPISVVVSGSTDPGTLRADITHTGKSLSPGSGTVMNFQNPVSYRVTAEDGSVKDYLVSVHRSTANAKLITGFAFNALQTAGEIDQTAHTIEVYVPASTNMTSLVPTLTYIGASITPPGGAAQSANPFTDSARDFTGSEASRTYRVTAADADGTTQDYTVSVRKAEQNTGVSVTFQGITDPSLMSASFDQTAGVVTLILTPVSPYGPPYEWYLDGHKLNVSGTEPRLEIHTAGMAAGQHEVVVVVTGGLLPNGNLSHYTNKVYFTVQE